MIKQKGYKSVTVPTFDTGTTERVTVVAQRKNRSGKRNLTLRTTDVAGNHTSCEHRF